MLIQQDFYNVFFLSLKLIYQFPTLNPVLFRFVADHWLLYVA